MFFVFMIIFLLLFSLRKHYNSLKLYFDYYLLCCIRNTKTVSVYHLNFELKSADETLLYFVEITHNTPRRYNRVHLL